MNQPRSQLTHYPLLDGLRGLAILMVVCYHNFNFINYTFFGWLGVDLFFVLSGFLITTIILRTRGEKNFLRNFYGRRLLRIFPLYYLTLILIFFIYPLFYPVIAYYQYNQGWFWLYLQNWLFIFHPPPTDLLSHLWSLAVEEQFYLIWPFIMLVVKKARTLFFFMLFLLIALVIGRSLLWSLHIEQLAYFNLYTFSRIDGICIGSMLALLRVFSPGFLFKHTTLLVFGLAGLNFAFFFLNRANQFSFPYLAIVGYTTFAVLFALLIHECLQHEKTYLNVLLGNAPLRFFGTISYSLYIFHWPVYVLFRDDWQTWATTHMTWISPQLFSSIGLTIVAVVLAFASYQLFEAHFLKLKKYFT